MSQGLGGIMSKDVTNILANRLLSRKKIKYFA